MVTANEAQDEIHDLVRQLVGDGWSDERIVAMLSKDIQAALQERRWEEPWMGAKRARWPGSCARDPRG
jgi:hypothetical protein